MTTLKSSRGYLLQEIIVGLVIFALAMLPVLRGVRMLPQIGAAIAEQGRREAWRSAADQAVLHGIDPLRTSIMGRITERDATQALAGKTNRIDLPVRAGGVQVTVLGNAYSLTAEERSIPAGFEIGAGTVPVSPRVDPLPPLPAIRLSAPIFNPTSGSYMPVAALTPGSPGEPFTMEIRALSTSGTDVVKLRQGAPRVQSSSGLGSAAVVVDALELAQSVRGQAWSEYPGDPSKDVPVSVGDRTRWLVRVGTRTQVYEPSEPVDLVLGVDLGRPVYSLGGVTYASGETVPVDYARAREVEAGRSEALVTYPESIRRAFGSGWVSLVPNFSWSFGVYPGDASSGNTVSFFKESARSVWLAQQTLSARPVSSLGGIRLLAGTWNVERRSTVLEPPERLAEFYDALADAPGWINFTAPILKAVGKRMGRPEMNGVESVNESVSVPLVP